MKEEDILNDNSKDIVEDTPALDEISNCETTGNDNTKEDNLQETLETINKNNDILLILLLLAVIVIGCTSLYFLI